MAMETVIFGHRLTLVATGGAHPRVAVDRGTLALLTLAGLHEGDRLLVLGSGSDVIGLAAAKIIGENNVVMIYRDPIAADRARANAKANALPGLTILQGKGFKAIRGQRFSVILDSPSWRLDFATARRLINGAHHHLILGGRCLFVVRRRLWYSRRFRAVFGNLQVNALYPYYVLRAEKRTEMRPRRRRRLRRRPGCSRPMGSGSDKGDLTPGPHTR